MTDRKLARRNWAVKWHLDQDVPLDCGCDDDTPDDDLCPTSLAYADGVLGAREGEDGVPQGPSDVWQHDMWVAAWGSNLPLVMNGQDLNGVPPAPQGMVWLATRMLVGGRKVVELALLRSGGPSVACARAWPDRIDTLARRMLQKLNG